MQKEGNEVLMALTAVLTICLNTWGSLRLFQGRPASQTIFLVTLKMSFAFSSSSLPSELSRSYKICDITTRLNSERSRGKNHSSQLSQSLREVQKCNMSTTLLKDFCLFFFFLILATPHWHGVSVSQPWIAPSASAPSAEFYLWTTRDVPNFVF